MVSAEHVNAVSWLPRPEGRVAYEVAGTGPLVVCVPGMGDLRASYRFLCPALVAAGYRVVLMDLRGHGDSDTSFTRYGDEATAEDIIGLLDHLSSPAVLVGNSMAAGAAVLVAASRPEVVSGLVLVGPFVRNAPISTLTRVMLRVAFAAPWAAVSWNAYLPKLYAGRTPEDFSAYRQSVLTALRRPGYARAFSRTTKTSHTAAEAVLPAVHTPALIVMGSLDPDFADPQQEAEWIDAQLQGAVVMVPNAGHYPQSQCPEVVSPAIASFLDRVFRAARQVVAHGT
jgi:pimeloyl-ACP methyl ester carboxylesterase